MTKEQLHQKYRALIAVALLVSFVIVAAVWLRLSQPKPVVLGTLTANPDSVQVNALVPSCLLTIKAYPEKRIPSSNNWGTILTVTIYNSSNNLVGTFNTTTNNQGISSTDICALGLTPPPGSYNFYLKGFSHLRKLFSNVTAFATQADFIDFTTGGRVLLAGETSNVFDNKINSLDLSTQIRGLYGNDYKNDLNQDGKVNSLDLSNTIYNFYKLGD